LFFSPANHKSADYRQWKLLTPERILERLYS
jgi:hypothetical protein